MAQSLLASFSAAYDTRVVLEHNYVGDGRRKAFKVTFQHITAEDADTISATVCIRAVDKVHTGQVLV